MTIFKKLIKSFQRIFLGKSNNPRKVKKKSLKAARPSRKSSKPKKKKIIVKQKKLLENKNKKIVLVEKKIPVKFSKKEIVKKEEVKPSYKLKLIGEITHYFSKISVVVIKLSDNLAKGDRIQIKGTTTEFIQDVKSMQIESVDVISAKKGQLIGLKISQQPKVGDKVFKILN